MTQTYIIDQRKPDCLHSREDCPEITGPVRQAYEKEMYDKPTCNRCKSGLALR